MHYSGSKVILGVLELWLYVTFVVFHVLASQKYIHWTELCIFGHEHDDSLTNKLYHFYLLLTLYSSNNPKKYHVLCVEEKNNKQTYCYKFWHGFWILLESQLVGSVLIQYQVVKIKILNAVYSCVSQTWCTYVRWKQYILLDIWRKKKKLSSFCCF